ncbi:MAG TPA: ribonuclease III [Candidatus Avanaerovorax faecigallinarum]|nr:ribonuclease III [Candidatus Avanaerovorax faecigallinarum]
MNSEEFQQIIKYRFRDGSLLEQALTHSSFCRENCRAADKCGAYGVFAENRKNNERLEFLGDALFDAVISDVLYNRVADVDEGQLTRLRALIVCENSLAETAKRLELGRFLNLGKGEERSGGRRRASILADAMEAIIGAMYIDGGFSAVQEFIRREFKKTIDDAVEGRLFYDYKTRIQEVLQKHGSADINYVLDKTSGPDHDKTFYVSLIADGKLLGKGKGKSKKEAEQHAARDAVTGGKKQDVL